MDGTGDLMENSSSESKQLLDFLRRYKFCLVVPSVLLVVICSVLLGWTNTQEITQYFKYTLDLLAISLVVGSILIVVEALHKIYQEGSEDKDRCLIKKIYSNAATPLFVFISFVLLFGAILHFALALMTLDYRREIVPAVIMSACAITLVALHQGVDLFLKKGYGGSDKYNESDVYLIAFIVAGGVFIIGSIWLIL